MSTLMTSPASGGECAQARSIGGDGSQATIQPHGVLLVIDPASGHITHASANAPAVLGDSMDRLLGAPWSAFVQSSVDLQAEWRDAGPPRHTRHLPVRFPQARVVRTRYTARWHLYADRWLIEIESESGRSDQIDARKAREVVRQLDDERETRGAARRAVDGLRELLGFDRVLMIRFDDEWNGEVFAESPRADRDAWLGLHFHAGDLSASTRDGFLHNRIRGIADVGAAAVPLLALDARSAAVVVNLDDVALRSASPARIASLAASGIASTLVSAVVIDGRLGGLIVCHHCSARHADHEVRDVADLIARALASRIGTLEHVERCGLEARLAIMREDLLSHLGAATEISADLLQAFSPALIALVEGDGVALFDDSGVNSRFGRLPDDAVLMRLRQRILDTGGATLRNDVPGVLYAHSLDAAFPDLAAVATHAAGILYIPLDSRARSAVLWTRGEHIRNVRWAGAAQAAMPPPVTAGSGPSTKGVAPWQELVVGRSREWRKVHLESARALRYLVELLDRKHYERRVGILHAALGGLAQPMLVLSVDLSAGHHVDLAYASPAFIAATGLSDAAGILGAWRLEAHELAEPVSVASIRVKPATPERGVTPPLPDLDLRPIGVENGRRCWIGTMRAPANVPGEAA